MPKTKTKTPAAKLPAAKSKRAHGKPFGRPGHPRKSKNINRITIRLAKPLYAEMNAACDRHDVSQRQFLERALRDYFATTSQRREDATAERTQDIARTGVWIDPRIVKAMDKRIKQERTSQRALLERAVDNRLKALGLR